MVYACIDQKTGDAVAVKQSQMAENEGLSSYAIREIALLKKINHENVVKLNIPDAGSKVTDTKIPSSF